MKSRRLRNRRDVPAVRCDSESNGEMRLTDSGARRKDAALLVPATIKNACANGVHRRPSLGSPQSLSGQELNFSTPDRRCDNKCNDLCGWKWSLCLYERV